MNFACTPAPASVPSRWSGLQNLLRWLVPHEATLTVQHSTPVAGPGSTRKLPGRPRPLRRTLATEPCSRLPQVRRPLRIVRVMETGQTRSQVGRMVISGRLADVCDELERLAACESFRR